jgi:hypothetical protein
MKKRITVQLWPTRAISITLLVAVFSLLQTIANSQQQQCHVVTSGKGSGTGRDSGPPGSTNSNGQADSCIGQGGVCGGGCSVYHPNPNPGGNQLSNGSYCETCGGWEGQNCGCTPTSSTTSVTVWSGNCSSTPPGPDACFCLFDIPPTTTTTTLNGCN